MDFNLNSHFFVLVLIVLWTIPWKGLALWRSAQNRDKKWFIALLVINTAGILEIIYLFIFSERKKQSLLHK